MSCTALIDCTLINVNRKEEAEKGDLQTIGEQIWASWKQNGYCILKNTGLATRQKELGLWPTLAEFFKLPDDVLEKSVFSSKTNFMGYLPLQKERLSNAMCPPSERKYDINDIKLGLNYSPGDNVIYPKQIPSFPGILNTAWSECAKCALDMGKCLGLALHQDADHFNKHFKGVQKGENVSNNLRMMIYPPTNDYDVKDRQMRCSPHRDVVFWSIVNQDNTGGLEVQTPDGNWMEIVPKSEDDIISIPGDLLQLWSNNEVMATMHKVDIALEGDPRRSMSRCSTIYFHAPDSDCPIPTEDGIISFQEFYREKFGTVLVI